MQKTHDEDLKPVHLMIEALRSGQVDKIRKFSDLVVPAFDKKLLQLQSLLNKKKIEFDEVAEYQGHEMSIKLHRMLVNMEQDSSLLVPTVKKAIQELPNASISDLTYIVLEWLKDEKHNKTISAVEKKTKTTFIKQKDWHTLETEDLRFQFTQKDTDELLYDHLKKSTDLIFDINDWLPKVS